MPDADHLLAALRGDDTHLHSLVRLGVDDLLSRRVDELVQPDWLAERVAEGLRASADDERTREWIRQHVHEARDRIEQHDGAPLKELNPDLIEPLKELLARPYSPDAKVLLALLDHAAAGTLEASIVGVLSNRADAYALERARLANVPAICLPHQNYPERADFDRALADAVSALAPDIVVMAGFMRVLGDAFLERFAGRMLNIHPSLLPRHPGLRTHDRVLEARDSEHGATVHFVTPELDGGPRIIDRSISLLNKCMCKGL